MFFSGAKHGDLFGLLISKYSSVGWNRSASAVNIWPTSFLSDGFRIISHGDSDSTEYLRSVRREDRDSKFNNLPSELVVCSRNFKQSLSLGSVLYGKISVSSRLKLRKIGGLSLTCIDKRGEEN